MGGRVHGNGPRQDMSPEILEGHGEKRKSSGLAMRRRHPDPGDEDGGGSL
jgi:hypothetical protein